MTALLLAISLSNSFTKAGAIVAFVAIAGIAILSLLVFSQAREIKRLREWAGRAPERALEAEQRVSAEASARVQRSTVAPTPARVTPRKTPLVSAPVSTAVHATAAAVPGQPSAADSAPPVAEQSPGAETAVEDEDTAPVAEGAEQGSDASAAEKEQEASVSATDVAPAQAVHAASANGEVDAQGEQADLEEGQERAEQPLVASAPSTPAAQARSALPPSPSEPAPPGASPPSTDLPPGAGRRPVARPPAPGATAAAAVRRVPSRAVGGASPPRSPSPRERPGQPGGALPRSGAPVGTSGPKYFKPQRSSGGRSATIAVAAVVVVVLAIVLVVSVFKGGGKTGTTLSNTQNATTPHTTSARSRTHAQLTDKAELSVTVLNGTSTAGLAHHLASDLQQTGYSLAEASAAVPPGTHTDTVVQYASGHRADAQAVAKTLNVKQVQAMESTTAALAGTADVVVLAGADQAAELGGGGAQSKGEPAVDTGESSATGAGATEGAAGTGQ